MIQKDLSNIKCQYLEWDSTFFHFNIARLFGNNLNIKSLESVFRWSKDRNIDCLYYLATPTDITSIRSIEACKFQFVDIRMTLEKDLNTIPVTSQETPYNFRESQLNDIPQLRFIAGSIYQNTRFYNDGHFSKSVCDEFYALWIEKSCKGYTDVVLVAESPILGVIGFVSCLLNKDLSGKIDLVGIHPKCQGKGIGQMILTDAFRWFGDHGVKKIIVVTQGSNYDAQRLYNRCGFISKSLEIWYHRWFMLTGSK